MGRNRVALIVVLVFVAALLFFLLRKPADPVKTPNIVTQLGGQPVKEIFQYDRDVCPGPTVTFKNSDLYLDGVVAKDESVSVRMNWFACHSPKVGDVVLYRYSWHRDPVLKRIVAVGGDRVDMVPDQEGRGWNLVVNDVTIQANGRPYFVGVATVAPPLKLYADANGKVLKPGLVLVLSTRPPGENDSGLFGPVDIQDIVGFVER